MKLAFCFIYNIDGFGCLLNLYNGYLNRKRNQQREEEEEEKEKQNASVKK